MRQPYERTVKPNGSILVRVVTGYIGKKPKRVSKTFPLGSDERAITAWVFAQKADHPYEPRKTGRPTKPDKVIEEWLDERRAYVGARTLQTYELFCKLYLFGRLPRFDKDSIAQLFAGLSRRDGRPLSPHTVQKVRVMLKSILEFAQEADYIEAIPKIPKTPPTKRARKMLVLSANDYHRLLGYLRETRELELAVLLETGLRVSELMALEPRHLSGSIRVEQARLHRWGSKEVGPPKSQHSYRTIEIPTDLQMLLREHVKGLAKGERFVFQLGQSGMAKRLAKACEAVGLPKMSLHGLRHSHCTFLLSRGTIAVPAISARMGHHSPDFTLRRYAHLVPGMDAGIGAAIRAHRTA